MLSFWTSRQEKEGEDRMGKGQGGRKSVIILLVEEIERPRSKNGSSSKSHSALILEAIKSALGEIDNGETLAVDMEGGDKILSCSTIGALVSANSTAAQEGKKIIFINPPKKFQEIISMFNLKQILEITN